MSLSYADYLAIVANILSHNQQTAATYAEILGGLVISFSAVHLTGVAYRKVSPKGAISRALTALPRTVERVCLRRVIGFRSVGHTAILALYLGINFTLALTNVDFLWPWSFIAIRCGWMAVMNLALTFFLAIKNTPLYFMLGMSYEKLNILHRWAGRTTFLFLILHVSLIIASYNTLDQLDHLRLTEQIHGQIAFGSVCVLVLSSISSFRTRYYELFYKLHVFLYLMIVINVGLHKPDLTLRVAPIIATIGGMWCLDRLCRTARMVYYSKGNRVTLTPLAHGATKIVFTRHIKANPGAHAFVWIPAIRKFETHPFTISSATQTEFVVRKQEGFTLDLYQYALQYPNVQLKAFFDGPYGAVPNFRDFERVVLLAGGSGASFTFAIAMDLISQVSPMKTKAVEFVWTIKNKSQMLWFENQLEQLRASNLVVVTIHITDQNVPATEVVQSKLLEAGLQASRHLDDANEINEDSSSFPSDNKRSDVEAVGSDSVSSTSLDLQDGRPNIRALISRAISGVSPEDSVGIAACGPKKMIADTRNAVSSLKSIGGPSLTLHTEQFGY